MIMEPVTDNKNEGEISYIQPAKSDDEDGGSALNSSRPTTADTIKYQNPTATEDEDNKSEKDADENEEEEDEYEDNQGETTEATGGVFFRNDDEDLKTADPKLYKTLKAIKDYDVDLNLEFGSHVPQFNPEYLAAEYEKSPTFKNNIEKACEGDSQRVEIPANERALSCHCFRTVLIGSYDCAVDKLLEWHKKTVRHINAKTHTEPITGYLIVYNDYFINMIEGSEGTLLKFLRKAATDFQPDENEFARYWPPRPQRKSILNMKQVMLGWFTITNRFCRSYITEKLDPQNNSMPQGDYFTQVAYCLRCMFMVSHKVCSWREGEYGKPKSEIQRHEAEERERLVHELIDKWKKHFPSEANIKYILTKRTSCDMLQLMTPREYLEEIYGTELLRLDDGEKDFPVKSRIAPYD